MIPECSDYLCPCSSPALMNEARIRQNKQEQLKAERLDQVIGNGAREGQYNVSPPATSRIISLRNTGRFAYLENDPTKKDRPIQCSNPGSNVIQDQTLSLCGLGRCRHRGRHAASWLCEDGSLGAYCNPVCPGSAPISSAPAQSRDGSLLPVRF
jgi:hypothetical protein